jgi:hypothetical protein
MPGRSRAKYRISIVVVVLSGYSDKKERIIKRALSLPKAGTNKCNILPNSTTKGCFKIQELLVS